MTADRISTVGMSHQEWLGLRYNGIGGSDVSSVLGLNPYKASAQLFYEKVLRISNIEENEAMFFGKQLEDKVAELWQYWDGTAAGMIENYNNKNVKRRCQRLNALLRHPKHRWLTANLDRVINGKEKGVLEIKTVSGWSADQWKDGIPPYFLIQLQTYLSVTGYKFGEIAVLKDGRYMEVIPFEPEPLIIEEIIAKTEPFWQKVQKGRELLQPYQSAGKEINSYEDIPEDVRAEFADLEPEPDSSLAYENYLKDRYKIIPSTREGTADQLATAIQYNECVGTIKRYEEIKRGISNNLKSQMQEAEILDFGLKGKITHREDSRGVRRFSVKLNLEEEQ